MIFFSFRASKQDKWKETRWSIKKEIAREYKRHRYLLEGNSLNEDEKQNFKMISRQEGDLIEYTEGIAALSEYLSRHFDKNPIVLIDEYDTPIQKGYLKNYYYIDSSCQPLNFHLFRA